jgi:hypothetical protein
MSLCLSLYIFVSLSLCLSLPVISVSFAFSLSLLLFLTLSLFLCVSFCFSLYMYIYLSVLSVSLSPMSSFVLVFRITSVCPSFQSLPLHSQVRCRAERVFQKFPLSPGRRSLIFLSSGKEQLMSGSQILAVEALSLLDQYQLCLLPSPAQPIQGQTWYLTWYLGAQSQAWYLSSKPAVVSVCTITTAGSSFSPNWWLTSSHGSIPRGGNELSEHGSK